MKLTIIGNCASGKTTLAKQISKKFSIPHVQLDRYWFEAGGHKLKKEEINKKEKVNQYIRSKVEKFIQEDNWVSDGFYSSVQPLIVEKADKLIFLNIPMNKRMFNHIHRVFFSERHPELKKWDDFLYIFEIIRRTFTKGPKMYKFAKEYPDKVVYLSSYREVDDYLRNLNI